MRNYNIFIVILGISSVILIIIGFVTTGNPFEQHDRQIDQQRISSISTLKYQIDNYYLQGKLPLNLDSFSDVYKKDPVTRKNFDYKILSDTSYQICTNFSTATKANSSVNTYSNIQTEHKQGYDCLTFTVPQGYTVSPTPIKNLTNTSADGMPDLAITDIKGTDTEIGEGTNIMVTAFIKNLSDTPSDKFTVTYAVNGKVTQSALYDNLGSGELENPLTSHIVVGGGNNDLKEGLNFVEITILNSEDKNKSNNTKIFTFTYSTTNAKKKHTCTPAASYSAKNYYKQESINYSGKIINDSCFDNKILLKNSCTSDPNSVDPTFDTFSHKCPNSCQNGACI